MIDGRTKVLTDYFFFMNFFRGFFLFFLLRRDFFFFFNFDFFHEFLWARILAHRAFGCSGFVDEGAGRAGPLRRNLFLGRFFLRLLNI